MAKQAKAVRAPQHKPLTETDIREYFMSDLQAKERYALQSVQDFATKILKAVEDPIGNVAYHFGWAESPAKAAAVASAARGSLRILADAPEGWNIVAILEEIARRHREICMREAKWPTRSTSPYANAAAQNEAAASADILETAESFLNRAKRDGLVAVRPEGQA